STDEKVRLDSLWPTIMSRGSVVSASGQVHAGLSLDVGFSTPLGDVNLFHQELADAVLYDFSTASQGAQPPADTGTLYLQLANADQTVHVHNFTREIPTSSAAAGFDTQYGIQVDYGAHAIRYPIALVNAAGTL